MPNYTHIEIPGYLDYTNYLGIELPEYHLKIFSWSARPPAYKKVLSLPLEQNEKSHFDYEVACIILWK